MNIRLSQYMSFNHGFSLLLSIFQTLKQSTYSQRNHIKEYVCDLLLCKTDLKHICSICSTMYNLNHYEVCKCKIVLFTISLIVCFERGGFWFLFAITSY